MLHAHSSFRPISESIRFYCAAASTPPSNSLLWLYIMYDCTYLWIYSLRSLFMLSWTNIDIANCAPHLHSCSRMSSARMCERIIYFPFNVFLFYGLDVACKFGRRRWLPAASKPMPTKQSILYHLRWTFRLRFVLLIAYLITYPCFVSFVIIISLGH